MRIAEYFQEKKKKAIEENPDKIERFERLIILRENAVGKPSVRIWRGEQGKPFANYLFKDEVAREVYIEREKVAEKQSVEFKQKSKAKYRAAQLQELVTRQVGDILYYSWGYDQTNIDWYQVTGKTESRIKIRPIASTYVEDSFMSGLEKPVKDKFTGPEELIVPNKFWAWDGKEKRSSSYA